MTAHGGKCGRRAGIDSVPGRMRQDKCSPGLMPFMYEGESGRHG
ncbi:MAG: hypothetical protein ACM3XR_05730 [Bacillota bacterium]